MKLSIFQLLCLCVFSTTSFSQTFDDVMAQRRQSRAETPVQNDVSYYQRQNQAHLDNISLFGAAIGENLSSPSCPTEGDYLKQNSGSLWPGTAIAIDRDVENMRYRHCQFSTSGGKLCKSYGGRIISCVTGQQPVETFCVDNGKVRRAPKDGFCSDIARRVLGGGGKKSKRH